MKTVITTTTGVISSQMILNHCGDYAGRFIDEACGILEKLTDIPEFSDNRWADIMCDKKGNVYAIWAEDALTCQNAACIYLQIEETDCPEAFQSMKDQINN